MTSEDAQNIATISGNMGGTVLVNPMLEATAGKVVKKRPVSPRLAQQRTNHQFVNVLGGITWDVTSTHSSASATHPDSPHPEYHRGCAGF